jgi:hypothetical protein
MTIPSYSTLDNITGYSSNQSAVKNKTTPLVPTAHPTLTLQALEEEESDSSESSESDDGNDQMDF